MAKITTKPSINSLLPIELIFQILSLLSPESLLRCRSICKQWRSLVSDHHFIKTHLELSAMNKQTHRLVFISRTSLALKTCSVQCLRNEPCVDTIDIGNSFSGHRNWARIIGSCNGLVCVTSLTYTLSIWNPSTRSSRRLIDSRFKDASRTVYGFGYDESSDDYKTVMIYKTRVSIYSLRTNSWKRILDFPRLPVGNSGKFVSGTLHWVATSYRDCSSRVIVSLDLHTENYGEVLQPDYGDGGFGFGFDVGVLEGCLCVVSEIYRSRVDVWVMKEYGVKESWAKLASIPYVAEPRGSVRYWNPLCVLDNGEILLEVMKRLLVYNPRENVLKHVDIRNYDADAEVYTYVESLVSPVQCCIKN